MCVCVCVGVCVCCVYLRIHPLVRPLRGNQGEGSELFPKASFIFDINDSLAALAAFFTAFLATLFEAGVGRNSKEQWQQDEQICHFRKQIDHSKPSLIVLTIPNAIVFLEVLEIV